MTILAYLDLSTGHLREETARRWARENNGPLIANYEYGLIVAVPDMHEIDDLKTYNVVPDDLIAVLEYAHSNDCSMIRFDADADKIEELPTYDW